MHTVSIIGGTGRLGAPVARALNAAGYRVRILTRDVNKAQKQLGEHFDYRAADILNVPSLKLALDGSDFIHLNVSGHDKTSYYEQHVVGTQNVLAAIAHQPIECISMISSASAHPEFNDRWDNRYKLEAETLLHASGRPYLAFLPSWFMETLPLFEQQGRVVHIGPSTKPIHWLAADDYAAKVVAAYQDPECRNTRKAIYGPEAITMRDAIARYADNRQLKTQRLPAWLAKTIGKVTGDPSLVDVADLMVHYDRTGEKWLPDTWRTEQTLDQWLSRQGSAA